MRSEEDAERLRDGTRALKEAQASMGKGRAKGAGGDGPQGRTEAHGAARRISDESLAWALVEANGNQTRAAEIAGCHRNTVRERLRDSAFRRILEDAERSCFSDAQERAKAGYATAIETLVELAQGDALTSSRVRLDAARALVRHAEFMCTLEGRAG